MATMDGGKQPESAGLPRNARVTLRTLQKRVSRGEKFAMLTCYDAVTAGWLVEGGVDVLLVGDTAAQMLLGYDSTLPVSLAFMLEITAAVRRGAPSAMVMADMPFGSYQCGDDQAVANAMAFLKQGGADCVKLEVNQSMAPLVARMTASGVPVVAHVGSRPQQVRMSGGFRSTGRTQREAEQVLADSRCMLEAGCAMLLVEAVPAQVAAQVVAEAKKHTAEVVPVIGCGAGPACDGQVVVLHDLMGLTRWQPPFAPPMTDLGQQMKSVAGRWAGSVRDGKWPDMEDPYPMKVE